MRWKWLVGASIVASGLSGGTLVADAYPPDEPPSATVVTRVPPPRVAQPTPGLRTPVPTALPETGSSSSSLLAIASGALFAGAGLVLVARRRHQLGY